MGKERRLFPIFSYPILSLYLSLYLAFYLSTFQSRSLFGLQKTHPLQRNIDRDMISVYRPIYSPLLRNSLSNSLCFSYTFVDCSRNLNNGKAMTSSSNCVMSSSSLLSSSLYNSIHSTDDILATRRSIKQQQPLSFYPFPSLSSSTSFSFFRGTSKYRYLHSSTICYLNRILFANDEIYTVQGNDIIQFIATDTGTSKAGATTLTKTKDQENYIPLPFMKDLIEADIDQNEESSLYSSTTNCFALLPSTDKRAVHIRTILKKGKQQTENQQKKTSSSPSIQDESNETIRIGILNAGKNDEAPLKWISKELLLAQTQKKEYSFLSNIEKVKEKIQQEKTNKIFTSSINTDTKNLKTNKKNR